MAGDGEFSSPVSRARTMHEPPAAPGTSQPRRSEVRQGGLFGKGAWSDPEWFRDQRSGIRDQPSALSSQRSAISERCSRRSNRSIASLVQNVPSAGDFHPSRRVSVSPRPRVVPLVLHALRNGQLTTDNRRAEGPLPYALCLAPLPNWRFPGGTTVSTISRRRLVHNGG